MSVKNFVIKNGATVGDVVIDAATSNISNANVITANLYSGNGNGLSSLVGANVTGQVGNALVSGTVYTNAQPNITSVGTLTSLAVTGNITNGNISGGNLASANFFTGTLTTNSQPNITSVGILTSLISSGNIQSNANVITDNILGRTGALTITSGGTNTNINLKPNGTGNIDANSTYVTNVKDPSSNQDAATKAYVDTMISSGISYHQPVNAATTTTLAVATSGTISYNQPGGAGNGIGAYLSTTGTFGLIDNVNIAVANSRILVKDEANAAFNGIYNYTNATAITRSSDADQYGPNSVEELSINDYFFTQAGATNIGIAFVISAPAGVITFGTSNIVFSVFSTSQVYSNGVGLNLNNTVFSIANTAVTTGTYGNGDAVATFTVNQQGQLTSAINTTITANAGNLSGTILKSTVVTSSLTSVGTLSNLTSNGTVDFIGTSNVSLGAVGNLHIVGGSNGQYLQTDGSNNLSWSTISTTSITNGNSNVSVAANGNVTISAVGNTIVTVTGTGMNVAGYANISGNLSAGNIPIISSGTSNITITSNSNISMFTAGNATSQLTVTSSGANIPGYANVVGNITAGNVNAGNLLTANFFTGTLTTAAQPNITSVGTLTGLTVNGNITANYVGYNNGLTSNRSNVAVTTLATIIDQFAPATFRTAKYTISASSGNGYQSVETLLVQDGTNAYITIYGSISSNPSGDPVDITANVHGVSGNVTLYATANASITSTANVNVVAQYIKP